MFESGYHEVFYRLPGYIHNPLTAAKFSPTGGSLGDFQAGRCVGGFGTRYEET